MDDIERKSREPNKRGCVVFVEDDAESRSAITALLEAADVEVFAHASPHEALSQAKQVAGGVDVLIVDYHLGDQMSGTELAETLAKEFGPGVPTIILTGDRANAEMPWLRNSPVWIISKPADPITLIAGLWPLIAFRKAMKRVTGGPPRPA